MLYFLTGMLVFFGCHLFSAWRNRDPQHDIKLRLGEAKYMGLYSLLAIAGFVLMLYGYREAGPGNFWYLPDPGLKTLSVVLMWPAMVLIVAAYTPVGKIKSTVQHPMLASTALWGAAHLLSNGSQRSVLLFGAFLLFAVVDWLAVRKREGSATTGAAAFGSGDVLALVVGSGLYVLLMYWGHAALFGVALLPG